MGETAESWQTWSNGSATVPTIIGDQDWGQLQLNFNDQGRSLVYAFDNTQDKLFTLTTNRYQAGQGAAVPQIRGSATNFSQDDNVVPWVNYNGPVPNTWKFVQIRIIKL